ncbi:hypothetical protein [Kitasatospora cinereorecta]|uniref:Helix-turn-helix domain-containing protein n=1 Tax=Kitasatospora cinereorecta TaxID=285560 RepID=A0ABW0V898_9ACTN
MTRQQTEQQSYDATRIDAKGVSGLPPAPDERAASRRTSVELEMQPAQTASGGTPGPDEADNAQEFIRQLRALRVWSGNPSLRELERRTSLPRSTLSGDLSHHRIRLPPLERVLILVSACGASAEEVASWKGAWQRIHLRQQQLAALSTSAPPATGRQPAASEGEPLTAEEPVRKAAGRGFLRRGLVWPSVWIGGVLALLLATITASDGTLTGVQPGSAHLGVAPATSRASYVTRLAGDANRSALGGDASGNNLLLKSRVAEGDTLVVVLMLTGTLVGRVDVRDTAGNRYRVVADTADADSDRLIVLVLLNAKALDSLDQIDLIWPTAKLSYVTVDEFRGVRDASSLLSGGQPASCAQGDLLFGAVGSSSDPTRALVGDWHPLPVVESGGHRLESAYRTVGRRDSCAATTGLEAAAFLRLR